MSVIFTDSVFLTQIVATVLGFLSGLGVGGGSLLILWLTLAVGIGPETVRSINLLFFVPSALVAGYFRWRQGAVPLKKLLPAILGGSASALAFSLLGQRMDPSMLKKLFGILLIVTGLRELFCRPKK